MAARVPTILATRASARTSPAISVKPRTVVQFAISQQPSIGGHQGAAKLEHQAAVEIQPNSSIAGSCAEAAIQRQMFQEILQLIAELRPQPPPALA